MKIQKTLTKIPEKLRTQGIRLVRLVGDFTPLQRMVIRKDLWKIPGAVSSTSRGILRIESEKFAREKVKYLEKISLEIRCDLLEMFKSTITQDTPTGSGHAGGSLSCVEILTTLFFGGILKYDPKKPDWPSRDRFVLSKGHAAPTLYAVLAKAGIGEANKITKEELLTLRKLGSRLQGHPEKLMFPEGMIEVSTGSLGQGFSAALGMAIGAKKVAFSRAEKIISRKKIEDEQERKRIIDNELKQCPRVFCVIGDGEENEGMVYETAELAAAYQLNNFITILDWNKLSIDGATKEVDLSNLSPEAKIKKWESLGWHVILVKDGHSVSELLNAYQKAETVTDKPILIIAQTIKGKGVSFMEEAAQRGDPTWHGKIPPEDKLNQALDELKERLSKLDLKEEEEFSEALKITKEEKGIFPLRPPFRKKYPLPPISYYSVEEQVSTRKAFAEYLLKIAQVDPRIITVCADVSDSVFPGVMKGLGVFSPANLAGRHLKVGVREQVMPGIAAGLENFGFLPVIGTYEVFVLRMYEQIRNILARDKVNAIIVGTHAGLQVGEDGGSHQGIETMGIMKDTPEVLCAEPADGNETKEILRQFLVNLNNGKIRNGPFYFRLTRGEVPILERPYHIRFGKGIYILKKSAKPEIILVTAGALTQIALEVSKKLEERGISSSVLTLPVPSWLERMNLSKYFYPFTPILTLQDASTRVMGNILGRILLGRRDYQGGKISSVGIEKRSPGYYNFPVFGESGSGQELYQKYYDPNRIVEKCLQLIKDQEELKRKRSK